MTITIGSLLGMAHIAIVGGGVAGLALGCILARAENAGFTISIFESSNPEKFQGTGFDIQAKAQEVLKVAGVFGSFWDMSRRGSNVMKWYAVGQLQEPLAVMATPKLLEWWFPPNPETNRQELSDSLRAVLTRCERVRQTFNCRIARATPQQGGKAELFDTDDQSMGIFDVVIDSSGFNSSLRKYCFQEQPLASYYTGRTMIHCIINDPEASISPRLVEMLGQGTAAIVGPRGHLMMLQRFGSKPDDHRTSFMFTINSPHYDDVTNELGFKHSTEFLDDRISRDKVSSFLHKCMGDFWDTMFHDCVNALDYVAVRPLFQHPFPPIPAKEMVHIPLIIIGDAAHTLSPSSGEGGNLALLDAFDVARYLLDCNGNVTAQGREDLTRRVFERVGPAAERVEKRRLAFDKLSKMDNVSNVTVESLTNSRMLGWVTWVMTWCYKFDVWLGLR